ncbi:hypothetical protein D9M70_585870 [compost metagenome]
MIVGMASGIWTLTSICHGEAPKDLEASIRSGLTWRMPRAVRRTRGARAKMMVTSTPGTLPMPKSMTTGTR